MVLDRDLLADKCLLADQGRKLITYADKKLGQAGRSVVRGRATHELAAC
jgi:hypothetical protein